MNLSGRLKFQMAVFGGGLRYLVRFYVLFLEKRLFHLGQKVVKFMYSTDCLRKMAHCHNVATTEKSVNSLPLEPPQMLLSIATDVTWRQVIFIVTMDAP